MSFKKIDGHYCLSATMVNEGINETTDEFAYIVHKIEVGSLFNFKKALQIVKDLPVENGYVIINPKYERDEWSVTRTTYDKDGSFVAERTVFYPQGV